MPITLANPGVAKLNTGISKLMAYAAPPNQAVTALYDRWVRFLHSSAFRDAPNTLLFPIYKTFAATYVATARAQGVPATEIDISLVSLAGTDVELGVRKLGRMLDEMLASKQKSFAMPMLLLTGVMTWAVLRRPRATVRVVRVAAGGRRGRR